MIKIKKVGIGLIVITLILYVLAIIFKFFLFFALGVFLLIEAYILLDDIGHKARIYFTSGIEPNEKHIKLEKIIYTTFITLPIVISIVFCIVYYIFTKH